MKIGKAIPRGCLSFLPLRVIDYVESSICEARSNPRTVALRHCEARSNPVILRFYPIIPLILPSQGKFSLRVNPVLYVFKVYVQLKTNAFAMHSNAIFMLRKFDATVPLGYGGFAVLLGRFAPDCRFASLRARRGNPDSTKQARKTTLDCFSRSSFAMTRSACGVNPCIFANNSIQLTYLLTKFNSL